MPDEQHYDAQVRKQLREAQAEAAELRRRYDDEHATAVTRAQEADRLRKRLAAVSGDFREARMWARHGYEIGQRHCGWADHGVAPAWLTDGWPPHIDSCEHLTALGQAEAQVAAVRALHQPNEQGNCGHCSSHGKYSHVQWPCPTALASGTPDRPARCTRCRGLGQIPDWTNWDRAHGEPAPKPCPDCPGEWPQAYPEWQQLVTLAAPNSSADQPRCCVCGTSEHGARTFYKNFQGQQFCWPCANCPCGQTPCIRTSTGTNPFAAISTAAPEFGPTTVPESAPPPSLAAMYDLAQRAHTGFLVERLRLESAIVTAVEAAGLKIVRRGPVEEVAAHPGTVNRLRTVVLGCFEQLDAPGAPGLLSPVVRMTDLPVIADESIPLGEVHLRPHPRSADGPS